MDREELARTHAARHAERPEIGLEDAEPGALADAPAGELLERAVALATAGATIDEIVSRAVRRRRRQPRADRPHVEPRPDAAPFERLRAATDEHEAAGDERPQLYLACMGPIAAHVNFANWAKSFFEVAGIETVPSGALDGNEAQAEIFKAGRFHGGRGLRGRKEEPAEVADLVSRLRGAGAEYVYMVNSTPEINEASGADEVVRNGVDMEAVLTAALGRLGVPVPGKDGPDK